MWETLLEMDRFRCYAQEVDQGATALVLGLAKVFERVRLPVLRAWATHFEFRRKIFALCFAATSNTSGG